MNLIKEINAIRELPVQEDVLKYKMICELIDRTAEDGVPIVRCKGCKHWNKETHGCDRNPSVSPWWEDDFCNYGARRDPEADYEWSEEEQAYIEQGYMDTQVGLPDLYMN